MRSSIAFAPRGLIAICRAAISTQIIEMLSEGITTSRGRSGAFLHLDRVNGMVRGRRGARLAAITSGGAIPDNANYTVTAEPDGRNVGTLDEDFAVESLAGDVFLLGTHSWRIKRVGSGRVYVEDAKGAPPSVPFWLGEAPGPIGGTFPRGFGDARERLCELSEAGRQWNFSSPNVRSMKAAARQAIAYVRAGAASLGALPSETTVVAERFFDEGGGMQLVLHAPFGSGSIAPGDFRCASVSAAPSTSNCRPPRPTTAF